MYNTKLKKASAKNNAGFTLVELSIVLVIISLIVAAIISAQGLVQTAKNRSVISKVEKYKTAVNTFRSKYLGLPGDIENASSYWPTVGTGDSAVAAAVDGDGNSLIGTSSDKAESLAFWNHLMRADLVEGPYDGIAASGTTFKARKNVPEGPHNLSLFTSLNVTDAIHNRTGNSISYSAISNGAIISAVDAAVIDTKADDGNPKRGAIYSTRGLISAAVEDDPDTTDVDESADAVYDTGCHLDDSEEYDLSLDEANCQMIFWM